MLQKDIEKDELLPLYKDIKYTLKELKQLALKHKIKITKIVIITINKKIKLEDFKKILIENNIKITKKTY
jgi:myo-inositol catabolism protein IolC